MSKTATDLVTGIGDSNRTHLMPEVNHQKISNEENNPSSDDQHTINYLKENTTMPEIVLSARKKHLKEFLMKLLNIRKKYTDEEADDDRMVFYCSGCSKRFCYFDELKEHVARATMHLLFRCQICLVTFEVVNICQIDWHSQLHKSNAGYYPLKIGLELVAAAPADEEIELSEVCPECRKEVACVVNHLWRIRPEDPVYQCPLCYLFATRNVCRYNLHIRIHKSNAPYICPDCAKVFKNSEELQIHFKEVCRHSEESMRYKCSVCGLIFLTNSSLMKHVFNDHNPVKYQCQFCDAVMNTSSERNMHYNDQHVKDLWPVAIRQIKSQVLSHKCFICGEKSLRGYIYERHVRLHFKTPDFKFSTFFCDCGFITMYKGKYLEHKSMPCVNYDFSALKHSTARLKMCIYCKELKFYNGTEPFVCEPCENVESVTDWRYKCIVCQTFIEYAMDCVIIHLRLKHNLNDEIPYTAVRKISIESGHNPDSNSIPSNISHELVEQSPKKLSTIMSNDSELNSSFTKSSDSNTDSSKNTIIKSKKNRNISAEKSPMRFKKSFVRHKKNKNYHCLECGEMHTTVKSLSIHLKSHGINDFEAYIRKYKLHNPDDIHVIDDDDDDDNDNNDNDVVSSNQPTDIEDESNELECFVCKEKFDNPSEQLKHLRSHGMAFLKRIKNM